MFHLNDKSLPILLFLLLSASVSSVAGASLSLHDSASALWAGARSLSSEGDLIVTGHPNGIRVYRKTTGSQIVLAGQLEIAGGIRDLLILDSLVYGLDGLGHPFIASISDPAHPAALGTFGQPHPWTALAMSGRFLLLAGADSVVSYDLSDPVLPVPSGRMAYSAAAVSLVSHDSLFLLPQGTEGLLLGIRHPDGTLTPKGHISGVSIDEIATDGSYGWSPQGDSGILVVDLTDPSLPRRVGRVSTYGHADHIALAGNRLLVADSRIGLISYRLIIRPLPFWQSELNGFTGVTRVCAESSTRFYAIQTGVSFPVAVDPLGRLSLGDQFGYRGSFSAAMRYQDWIYIADTTGIWRAGGSAQIADSSFVRLSSGGVFAAVLSQDKLFTAEGFSGAAIYRINDEGYLEILSRIRAETFTGGIAMGHDTLMVLDSLFGFQVYDITNPLAPKWFGGRPTDTPTRVAAVFRNYLYLSEPQLGVSVWNWKHVAKPEMLGTLPATSTTDALLIEGDRLYVADRDSGLAIFSLAAPSNPALVGHIPYPFSPTALHRSGRLLYVGQSGGSIAAVDVEDVSSLTVLAQVDLPDGVTGLSKFGERLWVTTQWAVHVVDVGPPLVPGDFNADDAVDVFDITAMISYCFSGGEPPYRPNAADVNADGQSNLIDIVLMIDYMFSGGAELVPGQVE